DFDRDPPVVDLFPELADLIESRRNKILAAKARVHGHDEHHINIWQDVVETRKRRRRIEGYAGLDTRMLFNQLNESVQMICGLNMHRDGVGTSPGKIRNVPLR